MGLCWLWTEVSTEITVTKVYLKYKKTWPSHSFVEVSRRYTSRCIKSKVLLSHRRQERSQQNSQETKFTKAIFRSYIDSSFSTPEIRGETEEHLGILGPVIKAEVGQSIMVRVSTIKGGLRVFLFL